MDAILAVLLGALLTVLGYFGQRLMKKLDEAQEARFKELRQGQQAMVIQVGGLSGQMTHLNTRVARIEGKIGNG
jgi:preprotein translocase subunit YajC